MIRQINNKDKLFHNSFINLNDAFKIVQNGTDVLYDRNEVHEIYREWRKVFNEYNPPKFAVAEAYVQAKRRMLYARPDELGQAFNFDLLGTYYGAKEFKKIISDNLKLAKSEGSSSTWVFNNHDKVRHTTRFGLPKSVDLRTWLLSDGKSHPLDKELGTQRARAATLMLLALPGCTYLYQGEELGLFEVRDIPENRLEDPIWKMSGHTDRGRDGCRVPIPWTKDAAGAHGFSSDKSLTVDKAWLPQSAGWGERAVDTQQGVAGSFFEMIKQALKIRKAEAGLGDGEMNWLDSTDDVIAFSRPGKFACYVNFGPAEVVIPYGAEVLISSAPLKGEHIPADTAVWLRLP